MSLLKLMSIESVMPSNHLFLCHPLLLLPSIFPTIRVFSNESVLLIRKPKYGNFSFSISPPNEYSGLISFRMDWLDLLAIPGTLKSLLQHHSSKASILCHPTDCNTPGLPVHHQLPEFAQTHVHRVSDAIQPSLPLSSPSPTVPFSYRLQSFPASGSFPMNQFFSSDGQSIGASASASVLPVNIQG